MIQFQSAHHVYVKFVVKNFCACFFQKYKKSCKNNLTANLIWKSHGDPIMKVQGKLLEFCFSRKELQHCPVTTLPTISILRYFHLYGEFTSETIIICKSLSIRSIGQNSFFILQPWIQQFFRVKAINLVYTSISKCSDKLYIDTNFRTIIFSCL